MAIQSSLLGLPHRPHELQHPKFIALCPVERHPHQISGPCLAPLNACAPPVCGPSPSNAANHRHLWTTIFKSVLLPLHDHEEAHGLGTASLSHPTVVGSTCSLQITPSVAFISLSSSDTSSPSHDIHDFRFPCHHHRPSDTLLRVGFVAPIIRSSQPRPSKWRTSSGFNACPSLSGSASKRRNSKPIILSTHPGVSL